MHTMIKPRYKRSFVAAPEPKVEPALIQPGDGTLAAALIQASERGIERLAQGRDYTPTDAIGDDWDTRGRTL
jgi:hypothetical protein